MKLHVKRPVNDPDKQGAHNLYFLEERTGGISKVRSLDSIASFKMIEPDHFLATSSLDMAGGERTRISTGDERVETEKFLKMDRRLIIKYQRYLWTGP